jgi:hypothetical protein
MLNSQRATIIILLCTSTSPKLPFCFATKFMFIVHVNSIVKQRTHQLTNIKPRIFISFPKWLHFFNQNFVQLIQCCKTLTETPTLGWWRISMLVIVNVFISTVSATCLVSCGSDTAWLNKQELILVQRRQWWRNSKLSAICRDFRLIQVKVGVHTVVGTHQSIGLSPSSLHCRRQCAGPSNISNTNNWIILLLELPRPSATTDNSLHPNRKDTRRPSPKATAAACLVATSLFAHLWLHPSAQWRSFNLSDATHRGTDACFQYFQNFLMMGRHSWGRRNLFPKKKITSSWTKKYERWTAGFTYVVRILNEIEISTSGVLRLLKLGTAFTLSYRFAVHRTTYWNFKVIYKNATNSLLLPNNFIHKTRPNVVIEWLTPLLLIREVPVSISARRPAILTEGFVIFLSPSRRKPG